MSRVLPILFNTDMVRAILEGRKTVTRRLVKPQPEKGQGFRLGYCIAGERRDIGKYWSETNECGGRTLLVKPPCQPGDILYVRETYCPNYFETSIAMGRKCKSRHAYKVDYHKESIGDIVPEPKWTPSIHMPKEAARIWLRVTDVHVERLQDITEEQAKAEGVTYEQAGEAGYERWTPSFYDPDSGGQPWYAGAYAGIWNSTVRKPYIDRYGWEANPYVWVIEFEWCEKPE